jgi:hypothetical protein
MPGYLFILNSSIEERGSSSGENVSAMFCDINHEPPLKSMETENPPSTQQNICVDSVDKLSSVFLSLLSQQKRSSGQSKMKISSLESNLSLGPFCFEVQCKLNESICLRKKGLNKL